jgi:hypothetical protein
VDPARPQGLRGHGQLCPYFETLLARYPSWSWKAVEIFPTTPQRLNLLAFRDTRGPGLSKARVSGAARWSLADARACAVRDAYVRATLADVTSLTVGGLPPTVKAVLDARWRQDPPESLAKLAVAGVGDVYLIEQTDAGAEDASATVADELDFVAADGTLLVVATSSGGAEDLAFYRPTAARATDGKAPLACATPSSSSGGPTLPLADAGWTAPTYTANPSYPDSSSPAPADAGPDPSAKESPACVADGERCTQNSDCCGLQAECVFFRCDDSADEPKPAAL